MRRRRRKRRRKKRRRGDGENRIDRRTTSWVPS
jgi:hypothetical protein